MNVCIVRMSRYDVSVTVHIYPNKVIECSSYCNSDFHDRIIVIFNKCYACFLRTAVLHCT